MKNKFCIANWKMYLNNLQITDYLDLFVKYNLKENLEVIFCPPYNSFEIFSKYKLSKEISIGSQNVSKYTKGGYTGEISLDMLSISGCKYVIVGHSERRELFGEHNDDVVDKFKLVYQSKLTPILCIGETIEDRKKNNFENILKNQIDSALNNIELYKDFIIAYEPIWAIGTGVSATVDLIYETHVIIKNILKKFRLNNCNIFLLYGGSVNEINAQSISDLENVDGFLIGSSSTNPQEFYKICQKLQRRK